MNSNNLGNIKNVLTNLNERTKELICFYKINTILKNTNQELSEAINQIITIIPSGWQYTDICEVQITINNKIFTSPKFKPTELKQVAPIIIDGKTIGNITICYIKPVKLFHHRIFLPEEQQLLDSIACELAHFISFVNLKKQVEQNENKPKINDNKEQTDITYLQKIHLSYSEIELIKKTMLNFKKGELLCKQGSLASYIILLKKGLVKIYLDNGKENSFIVRMAKPYEFIGLSALYSSQYYHFSAQAITPSCVYMIERSTFKSILENNNAFTSEIMKFYGSYFELLFDKLSSLTKKQALGRLAQILLYLSEKIFESDIIDNTITRKEIAQMCGISTENAVRILSELKNDGIITIDKQSIRIINRNKLNTYNLAG